MSVVWAVNTCPHYKTKEMSILRRTTMIHVELNYVKLRDNAKIVADELIVAFRVIMQQLPKEGKLYVCEKLIEEVEDIKCNVE